MATNLSKRMVCEWGMSEKLGMVEYGENNEQVFLARDIGRNKNYSEETAQLIDQEVKRLIDDAYAKAKELLGKHRKVLDMAAKALLEYETLDASHIQDLMAHGEMRNPPSTPTPPPLPHDDSKDGGKKHKEDPETDEDEGFPGNLAGVPA